MKAPLLYSRIINQFPFKQIQAPSRYLLVQSQQWKHQYNVRNLFKDTKLRQRRHLGVAIVNFEQISHIVLVFLLLTLNL